MKYFEVENENKRIDAYLSEKLEDTSRVAIQRLITNGKVLVNGKTIKASYKVQAGDKIQVEEEIPVEVSLKAQEIPLDIIYEDNDIIVINKPKGMVVHPANGNYTGTVVN